jgi:hypothetical protein
VADELTAALAIVGAATGVASLAVQSAVAHRDRARLRLRADVTTIYGKPPRIVIDVLNDSPRGTTVREVGLYALPVRIEVAQDGERPGRPGLAEIDYPFRRRPFFMEANETRQLAGFPDIFSERVHADQPLRVYAIDARNRRVWGPAAPYVRLAVGENPPIEESDDAAVKSCLQPDDTKRDPWPVEPGWKVWKPRELRRTTTEARAVADQQKAVGTLRIRGHVKSFDPEGEEPESSERSDE